MRRAKTNEQFGRHDRWNTIHAHIRRKRDIAIRERSRETVNEMEIWAVIALMLAAMVFYIVSLDESIWPGAKQGSKSPAQTTAASKR